MKEKTKEFLKKNLIGFVLGVVSAWTISVIAATYFPSNEVSYDNSESGLSSTTVKGAIDELYKTCTAEKVDIGGIEVPVVDDGDGLYEDPYTDGRYIYKGADPNNYITFNNEEAGWRIISKEADGTYKILRNKKDPIISLAWDGVDNVAVDEAVNYIPRNDVENPYCIQRACNVWCAMDGEISNGIKSGNVKKDSTGNIYLNTEYYNDLDSSSKDNIVFHSWNVGPFLKNQTLEEQIESEKSWQCNGNVGMISASDFLLQNSNVQSCGSLSLNNENAEICADTGWMDTFSGGSIMPQNWWWTINAFVNSNDSEYDTAELIGVVKGSALFYDIGTPRTLFGDMLIEARPAVFIDSSITLKGNGTQSDPYTIE